MTESWKNTPSSFQRKLACMDAGWNDNGGNRRIMRNTNDTVARITDTLILGEVTLILNPDKQSNFCLKLYNRQIAPRRMD